MGTIKQLSCTSIKLVLPLTDNRFSTEVMEEKSTHTLGTLFLLKSWRESLEREAQCFPCMLISFLADAGQPKGSSFGGCYMLGQAEEAQRAMPHSAADSRNCLSGCVLCSRSSTERLTSLCKAEGASTHFPAQFIPLP